MNSHDLIEELYKRSLSWEPAQLPHSSYVSFEERVFAVSEDSVGCFYGRPACIAELSIRRTWADHEDYAVTLTFRSIDDGCVPILGPNESLEKAKRRLELVKNKLSNHGNFVPTYDAAQILAESCGMYLSL